MDKKYLDKPLSMSVEINNICNAKCSFCAYGKDGSDPREKGKLLEEVFNHSIKIFSEGGGEIIDITPTLGEVTVDKRWLDLIKKVKEKTNISTVRSYSNGINLHKFGLDEILLSGLDVLQLSSSLVNSEMYNRLYGVNKFEQVSNNIINLCKRNYELGFPVDININLRIDLPKEDFFKTEFYGKISKYILKNKITFLEGYDDFNGIIKKKDIPINAIIVKDQYGDKKKFTPCYQLYRVLQVNYEGTIQGCACRVEPELWTDNVLNHNSLSSAWKNNKLEKIRNDWLNDNIIPTCCKTCTHYYPYTNLEKYFIKKRIIRSSLMIILKKLNLFKYIQYTKLYIQNKRA